MLKNGIIQPSSSSWSSPVILVKKRDGDIRFACDYRKLNSVTVKDNYTLPHIDDLLSYIGNAKYFTCLDLKSGFWQVPIAKEDQCKTAFVTHDGLWEFQRLSFGLCNAPATFQRLANKVYSDLLYKEIIIYMDDIIVFSETPEQHLERIEHVLERTRKANLTLKPSKCKFAYNELNILGFTVSDVGIKPNADKVRAIQDFPTPSSPKDVQSFIGMANFYRRFIQNFSDLAQPLIKLTKKNVAFVWSDTEEQAFRNLKHKLVTAPVLAHFQPGAYAEVRVDASGIGLGAILLQKFNDGLHPIAYASRTLTKAEKNYSSTEKECLGAVWGLSYFRPFIWGRPIKIITDHSALSWLTSIKDVTGKLARWSLKLQDYQYSVEYKPGKNHGDADALSRFPCQVGTKEDEQEAIEVPTFFANSDDLESYQSTDDSIVEIKKAILDHSFGSSLLQRRAKNFTLVNNVLYKKSAKPHEEDKLVIPKSLIQEILYNCHDLPLSGHLGFARTFDKINSRYYWNGMQKDVERYIKSCASCQARKVGQNVKPCGFLQPMPVPEMPFHTVGVDLLGPLKRSSSGHNTIIVVTDYCSRWVETGALTDGKATSVAKFILDEVICRHGVPHRILSDRGRVFRSELVTEIVKLMGGSSTFTTAFHPQTNGLTERFNNTVATMLSMYISTDQTDWHEFLPQVTFAYNSTVQSSSKFSPFELIYARKPVLVTDVQLQQGYRLLKEAQADSIDQIRRKAVDNIVNRQKVDKERYDDKHRDVVYKVGDKIKLRVYIRQVGKSDKLQPKFHGPFVVVEKLSPVNYKIQRGEGARAKQEVVHVNRMAPYYQTWEPP